MKSCPYIPLDFFRSTMGEQDAQVSQEMDKMFSENKSDDDDL
jgi:hypothetical protein